jgi:hypothetical protein
VVLALVITVRAAVHPAEHPPPEHPASLADKLDQKIRTHPPSPTYEDIGEEPDSSAYSCEADVCFIIRGVSTDARVLASITEYTVHPANYASVQKVDFGIATSYCFQNKHVAVSALRGVWDKAELLGKTDNCYLAVYKGSGPHLNTW